MSNASRLAAPSSNEIEQSVLGAILADPERHRLLARSLQPAMFHFERNRLVLEAMQACLEAGKAADLKSTIEQLRASRSLERIGGAGYVSGLRLAVSTSEHVESHVRILSDYWALRRIELASLETVREIASYNGSGKPGEIALRARRKIAEADGVRRGEQECLADSVCEVIREISKGHDREMGLPMPRWAPPGLRELYPWGLMRGHLHVLKAQSGHGKSTLLLQTAQELADAGYRSLFVNCEDGKFEHGKRMICYRAERSFRGLLDDADEWKALGKFLPEWIYDDPQRLTCHTGTNDWGAIAALVENICINGHLDYIFVDYLQHMRIPNWNQGHTLMLEFITRNLQEIAVQHQLVAFLGSQMNPDGSTKWAANTYDICNSEWILEPKTKGELDTRKREIEMSLAVSKNKGSSRGRAELYWIREYSRFYPAKKLNAPEVKG